MYSVEWLQRKYQLSFDRLWNEKEFADVTLVCEDDQQMEAHKIMLAAFRMSQDPFSDKIKSKRM